MPDDQDIDLGQDTGDPIAPATAPSVAAVASPSGDNSARARAQSFMNALLARGKSLYKIHFTKEQEDALVDHIRRDFEDAFGLMEKYRLNMIEMNENWRGSTQPKDYPFEDCANIRVPITSTFIEQFKARIIAAIFGGQYIAEFTSPNQVFTREELEDLNAWFDYELREVVKLKAGFRDIQHNQYLYGNAFPMAYYERATGELRSYRRYSLAQEQDIEKAVTQWVAQLVSEFNGYMLVGSPYTGVYEIKSVSGDKGKISFSAREREGELEFIAEIVKKEVIFDGVKVYTPGIEDLVFIPSGGTIEEIPFWGNRLWLSPEDYRQGIVDDYYIDLDKEDIDRICASSQTKTPEFIQMEETNLQDSERGTDQRDAAAMTPERKYIEVYRWEGWWRLTDKAGSDLERYMEPKIQYAVWIAIRARKIIKISRLEDLNKDGLRSPVHFGFIHEPNRLLDIGLAEWIRHIQTELDSIHNQRLDSGLLTNVPWGFYKPQAGFNKELLQIRPGFFQPVADPASVVMPQNNWVPVWSFDEERLVSTYGAQQAGLNDPAIGQFISKRQSASEFTGTASAIDLRTGDILEYTMESFRELCYRILGLYQQFGPRKRMFQVAGENGLMINKEFDIDKLQGRINLNLTANLQQSNGDLQRQVAMNMLQLFMNQLFIQTGVVRPETIYAALKKVVRAFGYEGVPFFKPDMPPTSDSPQIEHQQMAIGHPTVGPTLDENFEEHLHAHSQLLTKPDLNEIMSPSAQQTLLMHIIQTAKMQQQAMALRKLQMAQAMEVQKQLTARGVTAGGPGGGQPGDQAGPGTPQEINNGGPTPKASRADTTSQLAA